MQGQRWLDGARAGIAALTLLLALGGAARAAEFVSVKGNDVNLRSGPDTRQTVLYTLPRGYPLKVLEKKGSWYKVQDVDGDRGWIHKKVTSTKKTVIVKAKEANIRSGPGTKFDKLGVVQRDVILDVVERKGEWIKFRHPQVEGWIFANLVWP